MVAGREGRDNNFEYELEDGNEWFSMNFVKLKTVFIVIGSHENTSSFAQIVMIKDLIILNLFLNMNKLDCSLMDGKLYVWY